MNNLKKVLALGLALIMLMGMFTVVSAAETKMVASDLTDWNTVDHKDAVSLMVDLGIINGKDDGSFDPAGNIDRASWAKMVYFAATGSDNADAYLGTATGLNDISGNWAESFISYLKANKYISGDNLGNYNPSANVTVAEANKMMLTVLGYDAEDRAYQGTEAWAGNIMTDAKRNGLMVNVDSEMKALVPLTRENAAEIVKNALDANMVEGEPQWDGGVKHIAKYNKTQTLGYDVFGLIKVTATVKDVNEDGFISAMSNPTAPVVVGNNSEPTVWDLTNRVASGDKVKATASMIGQEVDVYVQAEDVQWSQTTGDITKKGSFVKVVSTTATKASEEPVKVVTSGTSLEDATTSTSANYVAKKIASDCEYYLNGMAQDLTNAATASSYSAELAKRGTVVEYYLNVNGEIASVKAYAYTADKVDGAVTTKKAADGTLQVRVPGVQYLTGWVDADKVEGWQGLEDGDVVLTYRTKLGDSTTYSYTIEKAEKVTGKVTTYSNSGVLTINGKTYRASQQGTQYTGDVACTEDNFKVWMDVGTLTDEYDFYLDKNGSIIVADQITESTDASNVCLVLETEVVEGSMGANGNLAANLLFADGSTQIVKVAKVSTTGAAGLKTVVDDGKLSTNQATADRQIEASEADDILTGDGYLTKFFNYRSTTSGYELTEMNDKVNNGRSWKNVVSMSGTTADPIVAYVKKQSSFATTTSTGTTAVTGMLTANNATTFIVGKADVNGNYKYSVYKGFKNVPEMDATLVTAIEAADPAAPNAAPTNVARFVYLDTSKSFRDEVPDGYIFIIDGGWSVDNELADDGVYRINVVDTDGTVTTMRADRAIKELAEAEADSKLSATTSFIRNFWAVAERDENGTVSALTDEVGETVNQKAVTLSDVKSMGDGVVTFANSALNCDYDESTQFIFVDMGWVDGDQANNKLGVREDDLDKWAVAESGKFDPQGWFNASDVSEDAEDGASYLRVQGTAIIPQNETTADYVYVVRYLW